LGYLSFGGETRQACITQSAIMVGHSRQKA
jgi:hypothetical protein